MVGNAITNRLASEHCDLVSATREDLDLTRQSDVEDWMAEKRPQCIFIAAAVVGGILANDSRPAEFISTNLQIQTNIISAAHKSGVEKLLFLGSSCIYPKLAIQPISEDELLTGPLEPTNQWYAIAKIAGVKQCQAHRRQYGCDFISCMPTNLYGPGDNFDLLSSHVLPALIVKTHNAKVTGEKSLTLWGTGTPRREFLYVEDLADACVFLMKNYSQEEILNVGFGTDVTIRELAETISEVIGFKGDFLYDREKPDGTPQKLLDSSRLNNLGWQASTDLRTGIAKTYEWYLQNEVRK